jgi:type III pantothenate kinase
MLLCADIGNSTINLCVYGDAEGSRCATSQVPLKPLLSAAAYRKKISGFIGTQAGMVPAARDGDLDAVVSSVVPAVTRRIMQALRGLCRGEPLIVSHRLDTGLTIGVDNPGQIGSDRIANAVAAVVLIGGPTAVVDFGTATTITVVGRQRDLIGGAILPGIWLMERALHTGTAKLPAVDLRQPVNLPGRDTVSSIRAGIVCGTAGAVERLVSDMERELGFSLALVLTGGAVDLVAPLIGRPHRVIPALTFEGMRFIYLRIRERED